MHVATAFSKFIWTFLPYPSLHIIFVYKQVICQAKDMFWPEKKRSGWTKKIKTNPRHSEFLIKCFCFTQHATIHTCWTATKQNVGWDFPSEISHLIMGRTKDAFFLMDYETQTCITTWSQVYCIFPRTMFSTMYRVSTTSQENCRKSDETTSHVDSLSV